MLVSPRRPTASPPLTEVATFRSDGAYSDGRHPDAVRYTTSAEEDVQRRDFTINGLLLDPARMDSSTKGLGCPAAVSALETWDRELPSPIRRVVIDHVGGLADLDAGILRAIGQPERRFEEDHLRMLRAVRFAFPLSTSSSTPPRNPQFAPSRPGSKPSAANVSATS